MKHFPYWLAAIVGLLLMALYGAFHTGYEFRRLDEVIERRQAITDLCDGTPTPLLFLHGRESWGSTDVLAATTVAITYGARWEVDDVR